MSRIEDYALLGDLQTAALVGRDGSIDWLCLPQFDSPSCFAALLGTPDHGRWRLAPEDAGECTSRRYLPDTLVLETTWETDDGAVRLIDFMPPRDDVVDIIRIVEGLRGEVAMEMDLALRFDYGHVVPWVRRRGRVLHAIAGPDAAYLSTEAPLRGHDFRTRSSFTVREGERVPFVLTWRPSHEPYMPRPDPEASLNRTVSFWEEWSRRCAVSGMYRDAVVRSLITLKALTFEPTGAIVAAATTSLPESIGHERNWDYRYCWLRDATLTLQPILATGYTDEAVAWREWLLRAVAGDPADLQIMYSITGKRRLPEATLDWLPGYENSAPVRTGNAAAGQLQLDVWGEVLDVLALTRNSLGSDDAWDLQTALMDHLATAWRQPDNSLWEMRGPRRHFTHSKVMAWVAADRMVKGITDSGLKGPLERWRGVRDEIREDVLANGLDPTGTHFVQSYGSTEVDAALLLIPRVGFLPYDDPRVVGTVEAVQQELSVDGFLLRYRTSSGADGLAGDEGVFLACSFWLVTALVGIGRAEEGRKIFERLISLRNDVGLLSEEYDPNENRQLGNTPQAFSHFGLINAAMALELGTPSSDEPLAGA
ncbi:glycoside hydrolase family 15 protein [Sinomonas sp. ASV486]|uniref:glycoside hydrolase family 15 protein n=1 Tax=Sinomonas sp. ASV486 TaxID=3051170 RepID=UPI0027DC747E|nr:glycoside hydrolase family 15 protein [Sinomonas sp. ASV486]MDQ4492290.1 glycoside hydrolase family 15 protein [Sinomonas sp. ASV486]